MDKIVFALDVSSDVEALDLVRLVEPKVNIFKIGPRLFIRNGPSIVRKIKDRGHKVFLDLKIHDIPSSTIYAVESASSLNVDYVTVHAAVGKKAMQQAQLVAGNTKILAVTELTSKKYTQDSQWKILEYAINAFEAGVYGCVCPTTDTEDIRANTSNDFIIVVPGIRNMTSDSHDQKSTCSPYGAMKCGANMIVVGRMVTTAYNPIAVLDSIINDINDIKEF